MWVSAIPGIRPGRRLRIEASEEYQWWRIIAVGQLRLREATASIELAR